MAERTDLAFPDLSADDFDRYAHQFLGNINRGWDHPDFPFNILTLPRLPKIHNASSQAIHVLIVPSVPLVRPRSHSTHWNLKVTPSSISTLPRPFSDMGCPNVPQDLVVRLRNPW